MVVFRFRLGLCGFLSVAFPRVGRSHSHLWDIKVGCRIDYKQCSKPVYNTFCPKKDIVSCNLMVTMSRFAETAQLGNGRPF